MEMIKPLRELNSLGVDVYFEQENIHLRDSDTRLAMEIFCALAQNESDAKSANIVWGIRRGFETGTSGCMNFTCYGYRKSENNRLVIVPKEARIIRLIFDLRLQGYSYGKISNELAKKKMLSPNGKYIWSRETIRKILCNEKYTGSVFLQKTFIEDFFTGRQRKNGGEKSMYIIKNTHEAIVSNEVFDMVQRQKMQ